jgi:hypothetical protein
MALGADLGDEHRESAGQAVRRFHHDFFGPGSGIVAGLGETIRDRFLRDADRSTPIPEGWVYWPITAGGLGLKNPLVVAGQYNEGYRSRKRVEPPGARSAGWNLHGNEWGRYYTNLLQQVEPVDPRDTKVMKTLVDDFIARGSQISAGEQEGLTSYWRWVLYTYGPQILQRFGTFRFLITELVPLQLISRQRVHDTSLDDAGRPAGTGDTADEAFTF